METRLYEIHDMEEVYTDDQPDTVEDLMESMRDRNIAKYRVKSIWSGDFLEMAGYPMWKIPQGKRGKKENTSTVAQKRLNDKNTVRRITRIVHTNFEDGKDLYTTWPYDNENLPKTPEEAYKNFSNFIRRQKYWLSKQGEYKDFELKYVYVTEFDDRPGKKIRIHHHMITNFPDRDILEELWKGGGRVQTRKLKSDEKGLSGVVGYILKDKSDRKTKRYSISRNMKKPRETISDTKMTRKRAERIACGEVDVQALFEKMYKGYQFIDVDMKFSDFTSGAYIYVRMKRIEPLIHTRKRE